MWLPLFLEKSLRIAIFLLAVAAQLLPFFAFFENSFLLRNKPCR